MAWAAAGAIGWIIAHRGWLAGAGTARSFSGDPFYFLTLAVGAVAGAVALGSFNLRLSGYPHLGHSIAGAIAGGILAVEAYKAARGLRGSTGLAFVAPLALGIAIGRIGCFFSGLEDFSYGTPTSLPWGVDFGDGISRHPVQLYESLAMLGFLVVFLLGLARRRPLFLRHGFYLFVAWYGAQRFLWEFLKPYPTLLGPFNVFHVVCLAMLTYGLVMMRRNHGLHAPR